MLKKDYDSLIAITNEKDLKIKNLEQQLKLTDDERYKYFLRY